jgi:hypothetical protein
MKEQEKKILPFLKKKGKFELEFFSLKFFFFLFLCISLGKIQLFQKKKGSLGRAAYEGWPSNPFCPFTKKKKLEKEEFLEIFNF